MLAQKTCQHGDGYEVDAIFMTGSGPCRLRFLPPKGIMQGEISDRRKSSLATGAKRRDIRHQKSMTGHERDGFTAPAKGR